ncbi:hypothetical protein [Amycolatopsis sp. cmx-11-51]|uniref:hypothetical protein n=1 Tax=unclassified Amycolatopsis TaxID=2618356 RepID=UPI0039E5339A
MQNWVKYLLRTTLASGGLLMLGTGVASATENVNPDLPASALDQHIVTPAVSGSTEALRQARPLEQLDTANQDSLRPAIATVTTDVPAAVPPTTTPVGPIYPDPDLTSVLDAVEPAVLPVLSRVEHAQDSLPVNGTVSADSLDVGTGTRVTTLHADTPDIATPREALSRVSTPDLGGLATLAQKVPLLDSGQTSTGLVAPSLTDAPVLAAVRQVADSAGTLLRK